jgi:hypothetical protein
MGHRGPLNIARLGGCIERYPLLTICGDKSSVRIFDNSREFEIDDAKSTIRRAVGNVPQKRIIMPDAVVFEFREQILNSNFAEMFDSRTTVASDNLEIAGVSREESGNKRASTSLEIAENATLVLESLVSFWAEELFMYSAVVPNTHQGALGTFCF